MLQAVYVCNRVYQSCPSLSSQVRPFDSHQHRATLFFSSTDAKHGFGLVEMLVLPCCTEHAQVLSYDAIRVIF